MTSNGRQLQHCRAMKLYFNYDNNNKTTEGIFPKNRWQRSIRLTEDESRTQMLLSHSSTRHICFSPHTCIRLSSSIGLPQSILRLLLFIRFFVCCLVQAKADPSLVQLGSRLAIMSWRELWNSSVFWSWLLFQKGDSHFLC